MFQHNTIIPIFDRLEAWDDNLEENLEKIIRTYSVCDVMIEFEGKDAEAIEDVAHLVQKTIVNVGGLEVNDEEESENEGDSN